MLLYRDTTASGIAEKQRFGWVLEQIHAAYQLKYSEIYKVLGLQPAQYTFLLQGNSPPRFEVTSALCRTLYQAGVAFTLQQLHEFIIAAYERNTLQQTHKDGHTQEEWEALFQELALEFQLQASPSDHASQRSSLHLRETRHLLPRDAIKDELLLKLSEQRGKKLVVVTGPAYVGKSMLVSWTLMSLLRSSSTRIVTYDFRSLDHIETPEAALRLFVRTLLIELRCSVPQSISLDAQTNLLLEYFEPLPFRLVIWLDHAECLLEQQGQLASVWERFFTRVLRGRHRVTLLLSTRQWPGWLNGDIVLVDEMFLPPLSREESIQLLRRLGLHDISLPLLTQLAERLGGIPQALEWVVALVQRPLDEDEWKDVLAGELSSAVNERADHLTRAIERLLAESHLFTGAFADDIAPLLHRIMENPHLSPHARLLLEALSIASVPLAQPALEVLCASERTRPIRELKRASLLVAFDQRIHVNAVVAAAVLRDLAPATRREREALLTDAYLAWLRTGQCHEREAGTVVSDVAGLLLKHEPAC